MAGADEVSYAAKRCEALQGRSSEPQHGNAGRTSNRRGQPTAQEDSTEGRGKILGFGPTLAAEIWQEDRLEVHPETLRRWMLSAGLWKKARQRKQHRRSASAGALRELVQMDGSFHDWYQAAPEGMPDEHGDDDSTVEARWASRNDWAAARAAAMDRKYGVPLALYTDWRNVYVREPTEKEQLHGRPVTHFDACAGSWISVSSGELAASQGRWSEATTHQMPDQEDGRKKIRTHEAANRFCKKNIGPHNNGCARAAEPQDYHRSHRQRANWSKFLLETSEVFPMTGVL